MISRPRRQFDFRSIRTLSLLVVAILAFLFAVQLLSAAMQTLSPLVQPLLRELGAQSRTALGIGWLTAYAMLNGSIVAAVALSLFSAELIGISQLFSLVAGSRLGAAGIVLLIGSLDFVRRREYSLPEAMRLGTLTFLVSHTIYVPATVLGFLLLGRLERAGWSESVATGFRIGWFEFFEPFATALVQLIGGLPSALLALSIFVGSLQLLDRLFERVNTDWLRERVFVHLQRRWISLTLGLVITALTSSVAFSIGVIVPVYNRGDLRREEVVPYVMGASLGTLTDTLIVASVLNSGVGVAVVLLLSFAAAVVTAAALGLYGSYYSLIHTLQERLLTDEHVFVAFLLSLVFVPIALIVL